MKRRSPVGLMAWAQHQVREGEWGLGGVTARWVYGGGVPRMGAFVGTVHWNADAHFTRECDYWWFGSAIADSCIDVALDLIRPLHPLCPESQADLPLAAGCPCRFNRVTDDVHPLCEDTDGDDLWETPPESR